MTPPIAHTGHWFVDLLYVLPLAVALSFLFIQARRDKRQADADRMNTPADGPPRA